MIDVIICTLLKGIGVYIVAIFLTRLMGRKLTSQLNSQDIKDALQVFYAGPDNSKKLYISKKSKNKVESHGKYGIE